MDEGQLTRVRDAWASWLQLQDWDFFFTATFKQSFQTAHPHVVIRRAIQAIPFARFGRTFVAAETHRLGGWHVHGLHADSDLGMVDRTGLVTTADLLHANLDRWGWNRVEALRDDVHATAYCAKYIVKGPEAEYTVLGHDWHP